MANPTVPTKAAGDQLTAEEFNNVVSAVKTKVDNTDTRLSDARTPLQHGHTMSDITNFPTLGTAAGLNVPASGDAATGQVVKGNDSRLTNPRTPTEHTHPASQIVEDPSRRFVTDAEKAAWNAGTNQGTGVAFDSTPTANSTNAVTSGGIYTALQGKQAAGDYATNAALTSGLATKAATVHTHSAGQITEDATHRFTTDTEKATWNSKQNALTTNSPLPINSLQAMSQAAYDALGSKNSTTLYFTV